MASYSQWRDEFLVTMGRYGVRVEDARKLLRYAQTAQRLAEAQCNGDYPYDGPWAQTSHWTGVELEPCSRCESLSALRRMVKGLCPDCRNEDKIRALVASWNPSCTCSTCVACGGEKMQCCECGHCTRCDNHAPMCKGCPSGRTPISVTFQGDPRGAVVRLIVDGRELAVPTR